MVPCRSNGKGAIASADSLLDNISDGEVPLLETESVQNVTNKININNKFKKLMFGDIFSVSQCYILVYLTRNSDVSVCFCVRNKCS